MPEASDIFITTNLTVDKNTTYADTVTIEGVTLSVVEKDGVAPTLNANDVTMKGGTIDAQSGTTNISSFKTTAESVPATATKPATEVWPTINVQNASLNIRKVNGVASFATLSTSGTGSLVVNGNVTAANITANGTDSTTSAKGIVIDKNVTITAVKLTSSGTINADGAVIVGGTGCLESAGTITAENMYFNAAGVKNSVKDVTADNTNGTIGVGAGTVTATGTMAAKNLNVSSGAELTAETVEVGAIATGGKLTVTGSLLVIHREEGQ